VVEEVLDMLNIEHCSVMAHSAGAPYALSFANRAPDRIRGDICLLAPWVGGSESGKCLEFICHDDAYVLLVGSRIQVAQICAKWYLEDCASR
jgi:pimeloyl-ACP methyl ester carboxylesterase